MIEINHTLLSDEALDNLVIDIITRHSTDYGEFEMDFITKKNQLLRKLEEGEVVIMYYPNEGFCNIIQSDEIKKVE